MAGQAKPSPDTTVATPVSAWFTPAVSERRA